MSRTKLIAIVIAVLVIGVGIGSCAKEDPSAEVTPTAPAATAAPLPTVTFGPEPTATPEPTPEPTEEPIPTDTPAVLAYMTYLDWTSDWAAGNVPLLESLSEALGNTDAAGGASIARDLRDRYRDGIAWLEANPPADCFAEHHALSLSAAKDFERGATAQIRWLEDFPYGTQEDYDTFEKYSKRGTETLGQANDIDPDC